jgi:hypothetical protein
MKNCFAIENTQENWLIVISKGATLFSITLTHLRIKTLSSHTE